MKIALTMIAVAITLRSLSATVASGPLPPCEFADTESATNHLFSTTRPGSQILSFQIGLLASPSNNVEIAIGRDSDEDGELSIDETAMVVGWDCGEWVVRSPESGAALHAQAVSGNVSKLLEWTLHVSNGEMRSLAAMENGEPLDLALTGRPPAWMFDSTWNLVKFTARGVDDAGGVFRAQLLANGTLIRLR